MSGCQKRVFEKKCALFVFVFFMLEKVKKENMKKVEKENFKKKPRKIVFLGGCEEKGYFCKNVIF